VVLHQGVWLPCASVEHDRHLHKYCFVLQPFSPIGFNRGRISLSGWLCTEVEVWWTAGQRCVDGGWLSGLGRLGNGRRAGNGLVEVILLKFIGFYSLPAL
jgi:hypothetical protein